MDNIDLEKVLKQEGHEDYVEYFIFPPHDESTSAQEKLLQYSAAIQSLTQDYIWQKDSIVIKQESDLQDVSEEESLVENSLEAICFHGVTRFGDNIEDEWFVTWVLLQLAKQFSGCVIRVIDNDGEFLLIEAADHLPRWAESDSACQQRVYLFNGNVHLIPRSKKSTGAVKSKSPIPSGTPKVLDAVQAVRDNPISTLASDSINQCIKERIGTYPEKMLQNFHHVNLILPPKLASVLAKHPELVSPAVNAFYYRDPIELKAARLMKNFKPGDCLIKSRVRFTKCLYAMLSKQEFLPDPKTGWGFPRPASPEFKAHSLGAKLTIGFEILLSKASAEASVAQPSATDLESSPNWLLYLSSLKRHGYFKGLLEGSKPYQELVAKAATFYHENVNSSPQGLMNGHGGEAIDNFLANKVKKLVQNIPVDTDKFKADAPSLPPDEDDSWMDISRDNLESMLEKQFLSGVGGKGSSFGSGSGGPRPEDIPNKLKEFLGKMAELEGVELPSPSSNANKKRTEQKAGNSDAGMDVALDPLDFRADDFVSTMDKLLLDLGMPDKDWDESEDEDMSYSEEEAMNEIMNKHKFKKDSKLFKLMDEMDEELAQTDVGKTFTTTSTGTGPGPGSGFSSSGLPKDGDEFDDVEEFQPVNIDINALTNMLKSFQSQEFPTGPSVNLLKSVGFDLSKASSTAAATTSEGNSTDKSSSKKSASKSKTRSKK